ncbi:MAG: bifunctional (p)ppGpp synthetase/guanosine-3',5'-bis(diphosphate) 3'-pyrophosphohydrolase [Gammaproteobacteria bacterium]|nr:bifunctional (p)ppGpp synthetase/guanosine-3',5'-bis(diphosphate) 3'-pyrophosphohydrolase [Gammaproteobacteria bacterium]
MSDINIKQILKKDITNACGWDEELSTALDWSLENPRNDKSLPNSAEVLPYILELTTDKETILATLLSDQNFQNEEAQSKIKSTYGDKVYQLVIGVQKLNSMKRGGAKTFSTPEQAERLRRLLLAIIDDVRVMLIKLCYRVVRLKYLKHCSYEERISVANESMNIYAPLANRLGIGHLKWEIEDLAFRALDPQSYKHIASLLEEKRVDREKFIEQFTSQLSLLIKQQGISGDVSGRVKHIVSIWRKMQRKKLEFHQLFDVRAVRILVDSIADCYAVLGIVHTSWKHVPDEFDDYVANPKGNGYQSIHTAVIGEGGKVVEIQIRTFEMHEKSEFGVASHWRYKEGIKLDHSMEESLMVLRELLDNSSQDAIDVVGGLDIELANSRLYVFSPQGRIVDLPKGATALDFAYAIHTDVGHKCRGAKVNGKIVSLTRPLEMAETVEILTAKESTPSRDWMNVNLGFLKSTSARSKVRNWFNHQDYEQNIIDGKHLLDKELHKFSFQHAEIKKLVDHFKTNDENHFFADMGRGLITGAQVVGFLQHDTNQETDHFKKLKKIKTDSTKSEKGIVIQGVGNLLTQIANCCKPVYGDSIIGYITQGAGVSIHKIECSNMLALNEEKRHRLIDVEWAEQQDKDYYKTNLLINAYDRTGLLKDISSTLSNEKLNLLKINSTTDEQTLMVNTQLTIEVESVASLGLIIDKLLQVNHVQSVKRINE